MKGICHIWSRGRHFSPSLPGNRYRKLISKSDLRAEISGSIVWYEALAPRPEVLRAFSDFYANDAFWVFHPAQTPFIRATLSADVNLNKYSKDCSLRAAHFLIMQIEKQIPNCMFEGCKTFTHVMNLNIECMFCLCLFLLSTCKWTRLFPRLVQPAKRNILLWFLCVVIAAVTRGKLKGLKNQVTEIPDS